MSKLIDILIKPLLKKDLHLIQKLIQLGMDEKLFQLTIFSAKGYLAYLQESIENNKENQTTKIIGAYKDDELIGFAEWRIMEDTLFLNNIHIHPHYRENGVGKRLLEVDGVTMMNVHGKTSITLDVFSDNEEALSWYEKLGFRKSATKFWYIDDNVGLTNMSKQMIANNRLAPFMNKIENLRIANEHHDYYGFSLLKINTGTRKYEVGRMNDQYYKVQDVRVLQDIELLRLLHQLDAERKLLIVTEQALTGYRPQYVSIRMKWALNR